jgi:U3 small nucleolar RNA-associated protein 20
MSDPTEDGPRVKRFKHQSYNQTLKDVHLPSVLGEPKFDYSIDDNDSHFHNALEHWKQLNLSPDFIRFAHVAAPLSASMPLLLHNAVAVTNHWLEAAATADDEGLRALLDLLQHLAHDLRTSLSPAYPGLLARILGFLPRALPAPTLTALLAALSALFSALLVPTRTPPARIPATWTRLRAALPTARPETQRAVAEVWGAVLRRLKGTLRAEAATLVAADSKGIEDASAWIFVYACKSVSQTLHTSASPIISALLNHYLECENSSSALLLHRVLTALAHHVQTADQYAPLADVLVSSLTTAVVGNNPDLVRRALDAVTIPCAVRQGSRLSSTHLTTLTTALCTPAALAAPDQSFLRCAAAALCAGAPHTALLDAVWMSPIRGLRLAGALAEMRWIAWRVDMLPRVLRASPAILLDADAEVAAGAAAALVRLQGQRKLGDTDAVWRTRVGTWAAKALAEWGRPGDSAARLNDVLALAVHASNIAPALAALVDSALNAEVADARTAGACMLELARRGPMEWSAANVDVGGWVPRALARCPGEEVLLGGIVALVQASDAADIPALTLENLYPSLQDALISHRRDLRLNALRLLAAPGITMPVGARDAVRRCLQGEEVPLDVAGVRARVLRIGRAAPGVRNGDKVGADICARWLIAQLKANLRPLWSPAAAALAGLAERFGEEVWTLVFSELKDVSKGISSEERGEEDERKNLEEQGDVEESEEREEERTWRDPSAYKLRTALANWLRQDLRPVDPVTPESNDRLDHRSYHLQLLATLSECAALAEKHNRELIPLFLDLADPTTGPRLPRTQLAAWLALLARFTNPKAIMRTDSLRALYTDLLAHADRALQRAALACVLTYKDPGLAPHADRLHALLDDTRWRDELTALDIPALPPRGRSEVVGVLIRLLFGMMLEKRGRARGADRRAAVLGALAACENSELGLLVNLMLRPLGGCDTGRMATGFTVQALPEGVSEKQQIGFLTLLGDVLKNLGTRLVEHWPVLLGATIDTLAQAQARIDAIGADEEREGEEEEIEDDEDDEPKSTTSSKMTRSIRQLGLKRFANFFRLPVTFDFAPFMPTCFATFISPRLANLDRENTQAPSALLELFHVWALHGTHVRHLVAHDKRVIPMMYACLVAGSVKPAVIAHIFDTIERLLALSADDAWVAEHIVKPHVSLLLANLALLVERTKDVAAVSSPLGQRQIWILSEIAQYSTDGTQASTLLELFSPLLRRPAKMVPEKVKIDILKIIGNLLPLIADLADHTSTIYARTYKLLSQLFQTLRSRNARLSLVSAFHQFALIDSSLQPLADLLESLNAYSAKRIEEPDFDRRLEAFAKLNEVQFRTLSSQDWLPVVYNMLHSIQDQTELAVRNNASFALKNFIELAAIDSSPEIKALFVHTLYPGLKNGLHSKNEMVRAEILGVIAHAVAKCENIEPLQEMRVLLEGGDEEADFFNNIHHVQIHRRSRALRRLADHCDKGHLRSNTLAEIFVPLVGNYVVSSPSADHHLVNEAISTTGRIAKHLTWGAYNTLVQKYLRLSRDKDLSERIYVRTLVALLDSFHFPMEEVVPQATATLDVEDPTQLDETDEDETVAVPEQSLASTKNVGKIADAVNLRLLPTLLQHLEKHDKTTEDSTRIPIAIGIVKVAMHLPTATREPQITRLVTILSQILRSRSQETRDLTRDTLIRIAITLGPSYLPLMLREMRAALLRGPQLHVLAYVTHSMLVHVTAGQHSEVFHTLDDCVADISHVSAEVIFGESGKDVQADEFKTKMREVRVSSANGLDSFGIAARYVTPSKISSLLAPLRAIMQETESLKVMQVVDEVLKRITTGLNANKHLIPTELLVLCHTLITQNARFLQQAPLRKQKRNVGDAIVQTKRKLNTETDHYAVNSFRYGSSSKVEFFLKPK